MVLLWWRKLREGEANNLPKDAQLTNSRTMAMDWKKYVFLVYVNPGYFSIASYLTESHLQNPFTTWGDARTGVRD